MHVTIRSFFFAEQIHHASDNITKVDELLHEPVELMVNDEATSCRVITILVSFRFSCSHHRMQILSEIYSNFMRANSLSTNWKADRVKTQRLTPEELLTSTIETIESSKSSAITSLCDLLV